MFKQESGFFKAMNEVDGNAGMGETYQMTTSFSPLSLREGRVGRGQYKST